MSDNSPPEPEFVSMLTDWTRDCLGGILGAVGHHLKMCFQCTSRVCQFMVNVYGFWANDQSWWPNIQMILFPGYFSPTTQIHNFIHLTKLVPLANPFQLLGRSWTSQRWLIVVLGGTRYPPVGVGSRVSTLQDLKVG